MLSSPKVISKANCAISILYSHFNSLFTVPHVFSPLNRQMLYRLFKSRLLAPYFDYQRGINQLNPPFKNALISIGDP